MVIKVGINGFGRIGRIVSRACLENSGIQLSAINDPAISVEYVRYLMKFDSTHGKLNGIITYNDEEVVINGKCIKVFHEKYPSNIPWQSAGVQYVIEASGMFTSYEKASGHLLSVGVKRVIVTAPSVDIPMVVLGVNDKNITADRRVISCASSTLYCLAPIIKVLEDSFGVEEGFITSIHAMTPSLKPLDGLCLRGRHWRDHRSIHQNIIPAPTGACKALGKILPGSKDKLSGIAFRVPVVNVSVLDLTVRLQISTTLEEIMNHVQKASKSNLRNIIKISDEEAVSSDFASETHSCIVDVATSIQLKSNFYKIICWYENEYSYAHRIVDSIFFSENQYFFEIPKSIKTLRPVTSSKMLQTDIPLIWDYKNEVVPNIRNVSQDMSVGIRTPIIPFVPHKSPTISAINTSKDRCTKTNDISKIWNNRCENLQPCMPPNKCSLFQSCVGFPSTIKRVECNNQERLESVRREFTKMVNITEDLLRKTQSTQGVRSLSKDEIKLSRPNLIIKERDANNYTIKNSKIKSVEELVDSKCSGDMIQLQNDKHKKVDEKSELPCNSNIVEYMKNIDVSSSINKLKRTNADTGIPVPKMHFENEANYDSAIKLDRGESKQITETIIATREGLSQNEEFKFIWNHHYHVKNKEIKKLDSNAMTENIIRPFCNCEELSNEKENKHFAESNDLPRYEEDKIAVKNIALTTKNTKINLIDEALRKRNIVLVNHSRVTDNKSETFVENIDVSHVETVEKIDDIVPSKEPVVENYPLKLPLEESKCGTPENTVTTVSNDIREERQDIYDKLDSASGTDSNNSFEIKERKSQVIQLTDLTNSLEDLTSLNNICRIIEISDELSDKLFSALDDDSCDVKTKKWSFKDLCARIKLDEFCNKVFGGTAVTRE